MLRKSVAEGSQGGDSRQRLRVVSHTLHEVGSTIVLESPTIHSPGVRRCIGTTTDSAFSR